MWVKGLWHTLTLNPSHCGYVCTVQLHKCVLSPPHTDHISACKIFNFTLLKLCFRLNRSGTWTEQDVNSVLANRQNNIQVSNWTFSCVETEAVKTHFNWTAQDLWKSDMVLSPHYAVLLQCSSFTEAYTLIIQLLCLTITSHNTLNTCLIPNCYTVTMLYFFPINWGDWERVQSTMSCMWKWPSFQSLKDLSQVSLD